MVSGGFEGFSIGRTGSDGDPYVHRAAVYRAVRDALKLLATSSLPTVLKAFRKSSEVRCVNAPSVSSSAIWIARRKGSTPPVEHKPK